MKDKRVAKSIKFNPDNKIDKVILDYLEDKNFSEIVKTHIYGLATGAETEIGTVDKTSELNNKLNEIKSLVESYSEKLERLNRLDRLDMLDVLIKYGAIENIPVEQQVNKQVKKERKKETVKIPKRKVEFYPDEEYSDESESDINVTDIRVEKNYEESEEPEEENDIAFGLLSIDDE